MLVSPDEWACDLLRGRWAEIVERSDHPFSLLQSPEWFDHMVANGGERLAVAVAHDETSEVAAVVPVRASRGRLELHVVRGFHLGNASVDMFDVLGGEPLMPQHDEAFGA